MVLVATSNQHSSGLGRACSTSTIEIESITLMQCLSVLSVATLLGHFYSLNDILQPPHTMTWVDVEVAATPNYVSSGRLRSCSTSPIEIDIIALMQCPSVLSAPTLMGHFYSLYAMLQELYLIRR